MGNIDRSADRLEVLDELARSFAEDHERHRDNLMNSTLFVLTVGTVVFMPAQFLAAVYGMNFVNKDGSPAFEELRYGEKSYLFFWCLVAVTLCLGSLLVWCF